MTAGGGSLFQFAEIAFGLREGLIALLALVALYIVVVLWRMRRLRRVEALPPQKDASEAENDIEEQEALAEPPPSVVSAYEPPVSAMAGDNRELQREVRLLRDELDAVRGELAALREDMYQELNHVRAAQTVSPIYGDAMQMAVSGYDAAAIAERCGIARAEAELVVALANSRE